MKSEKIKNTLLLLALILFIILLINKSFQNDTFFTIAIGNNIIKNGIETEERLVWHEGLNFTNPRWLFDILIARNLYQVWFFGNIYFCNYNCMFTNDILLLYY